MAWFYKNAHCPSVVLHQWGPCGSSWDSPSAAQTPLGLCEPHQGCHGLGLRWTLPRSASDTLRFTPPSATGFRSRGRGGRLRRPPAGVYLTWKSAPFPLLQLEPLEMGTERYISREKAHLFKGLVLDLFMYLTNTFKFLKIFQPNNDSKIHNNRTNSGKPTKPLKKDFSKHSRSCCIAFHNRRSLPAPPRGDHPPELAVNISGLFSEHLLCARQSAG